MEVERRVFLLLLEEFQWTMQIAPMFKDAVRCWYPDTWKPYVLDKDELWKCVKDVDAFIASLKKLKSTKKKIWSKQISDIYSLPELPTMGWWPVPLH